MIKKIKRFNRKRYLKQYLYQSLESDSLYFCQVDGLYTLLSGFIERNGVRRLVRLLDEEQYLCLWSFLLDLKEKYPFMFSDDKEDD